MTEYKRDMLRIQALAGEAYAGANALTSFSEGTADPAKLQRSLEEMLSQFEASALALRELCEAHSRNVESPFQKPTAPGIEITGSIDLIENHWLHIRLETLLPHCRYQPPAFLADTLRRLLDAFERGGQKLPFFQKALLVIDEHSRIGGRGVYDQDNKGWKAIPNALKGRVIPDDDQYSLGVALLSSWRPDNVCHITLMDMQDATDFFALRSEPYTMDSMYQGF